MDSIDRLSKFTLVACDQSYQAQIGKGETLAPYYDSGTADHFPSTMPAEFYDPYLVGLSEWTMDKRINDPKTGFGAPIYQRTRADGSADYMIALQGTRGPNTQDWSGNLVFGWDKWEGQDGGRSLMDVLDSYLTEGKLSGDIYFTGQLQRLDGDDVLDADRGGKRIRPMSANDAAWRMVA